MIQFIFAMAFLLGLAAVVAMGANFLHVNSLALAVTGVIGVVYVIGFVELVQFRRATGTLSRALSGLGAEAARRLSDLEDWLAGLHPSLQQAVRRRVEGERAGLPAPVLTPYLVSLLVMLGLLGTFVGLVETLKGVVVALEGSSELEAIRRALTAPMDGLGMAFGTSVAGVAASAMLGLMSTLSRRDRQIVARLLDHKIATDLKDFSLTHQRQETFKALQVQSQSLPAIAERLQDLAGHMERMTDRLGEQLVGNQTQFHDSVRTLYEDLAASVESSLRDSLTKTDQVLRESARLVGEGVQPVVQQAMTAIGAEIGASAQTTHRQLVQSVQERIEALSGRFAETSGAVARAWQDGVAAHERSNQRLVQGMTESFEALREQFGRDAEELLKSLERGANGWNERQQEGEEARLIRWTEALQLTQQQSTERLEAVSSAVADSLRTTSASQLDAMQSATDALSALSAELTAQLLRSAEQAVERQQALTAGLDATTRSVVDGTRVESERVLGELARLLSASESLVEARVDSERSWLGAHEERLARMDTTLQSGLSALRDEEAKRGSAAVERLAALETTVAAHLAELGQALEAPMTRLIGIASETPKAAAEVIGQLRSEISSNIERDNRMLEERGRLLTELDALSESLARSTAGQLAAIEKLVEAAGERLGEIGEQFSGRVEGEVSRASDAADQFAIGAAEIASLGEAFAAAVNLYSESSGRLLDGLDRIEASLERSTDRSDEQLGYYVAQAREVIDYSVSTQKEVFDELRQLRQNGAGVADPAEVN
jgi:hypothetical protein